MDINTVLKNATEQLYDFEQPYIEAEYLLSYSLNKSRVFLRAFSETELTEQEIKKFNAILKRRQQGEPLPYITCEKEFWSLTLKVTPDVLIPRPETELLVEKTLSLLPKDKSIIVADLGTGSGAIALALASERPNWQIIATDNNTKALAIAEQNARILNVNNVQFFNGNWCQALPNKTFDVILSNPPYVDRSDIDIEKNVRKFEPDDALFSNDQGLADIKHIAEQALSHLKLKGYILLEHGCRQSELVRNYLQQLNYKNIITYNDLNNLPRITMGQK